MQAERIDVSFCGHCGDRLPLFGARLGFCPDCARRYRDAVKSAPRLASHRKDPALAVLLSVVLPGGGQLYCGRWLLGLLILVTSPFVVPWLFGIVHAYFAAETANRDATELEGARYV
jgi:hypothetical protein